MKIRLASILLSCSFLAACGGDDGPADSSGVDGDKAITDLTASEVSAVCEWGVEVSGGEGYTEDCGDFDYTVETVAECEAGYASIPAACSTVTVAELEACIEAVGADPCTAFGSQACAEYVSCFAGA